MEKDIPSGLRCYELIEIIDFNKGDVVIRQCPYLEHSDDGIYSCSFLGEECKEGDENFKVWNMEKECNVNVFNNYDTPEFYFNLDD
jgi:hypothetical protein